MEASLEIPPEFQTLDELSSSKTEQAFSVRKKRQQALAHWHGILLYNAPRLQLTLQVQLMTRLLIKWTVSIWNFKKYFPALFIIQKSNLLCTPLKLVSLCYQVLDFTDVRAKPQPPIIPSPLLAFKAFLWKMAARQSLVQKSERPAYKKAFRG